VPFNLTYNSQNWRKDDGGTWNMGQDVGYGYGWKLFAGALTPQYAPGLVLHHYLFTDATGAEYRLDVNTGGVWTSRESIYVTFDSNTNRLYFNNGTRLLRRAVLLGGAGPVYECRPTIRGSARERSAELESILVRSEQSVGTRSSA